MSRLSSAISAVVEGGGTEAKCSSLRPRCTSCTSGDNGCGLVDDEEGLAVFSAVALDFDLFCPNWKQVRILPIALLLKTFSW